MKFLLAAALMVATVPTAFTALASEGAAATRQERPVIGLGFWLVEGGIEVNDVSRGSAAERAGLKAGMLITRINGAPLAEMEIVEVEQMVAALQGEMHLRHSKCSNHLNRIMESTHTAPALQLQEQERRNERGNSFFAPHRA